MDEGDVELYEMDNAKIPVDEGETEEVIEVEEPEDVVDEGEYDYPEDVDYNYSTKIVIASFTNENDISYVEIPCERNEYMNTGEWGIDSEENFYMCISQYDDETWEETYTLRKYSNDGTLIKSVPLESNADYMYIRGVRTDKDGNSFVALDDSIQIYNKDLVNVGSYKIEGDGYISSYALNEKGEYVAIIETWTENSSSIKVVVIKADGSANEDTKLRDAIGNNGIMSGAGYDYYIRTSTSVYGYDEATNKSVEVVNFLDSDINPTEITGDIVFMDAEHFIICYNENEIGAYEKVPADQVKDKEVITVGTVWSDYAVTNQIIAFNKASDDYRIRLIDYSEYSTPDDWYAGEKRFNTDITGGNCPDIIVCEPYQAKNFMNKGLMTDLTPLMANGSNFKKEDLVPNAQTMFAKEDKLYFVFPTFEVQTLEMKASLYKDGMTLDDIIAWENSTGKKAFGSDYNKESVLNMIMTYCMDSFLDTETGKCNFDSDEFIKALEYANTYPTEVIYDDDSDYYKEYIYQFRNDNALFASEYISNFRDYNWQRNYRFGEKTKLLGMPFEGSDGAIMSIDTLMGISDKCKNKEAAWEFVNSFFSDEYYENRDWGIPSIEKRLDEMAEESTKPRYFENENGEMEEDEEYIWIMDEQIKIDPLTMEEAAELKSYVISITGYYNWDEEINGIIDEETQPYFAGQKSAKEVAGVIQSRLQIYINEMK